MIRMLKSTSYNGVDYPVGKECKAPDPKTESRWVKNGIAEIVNKPGPEKPAIGPGKQTDK